MEAITVVGTSVGAVGLAFGLLSWIHVADLREELEGLKKRLEDSGVLPAPSEFDDQQDSPSR